MKPKILGLLLAFTLAALPQAQATEEKPTAGPGADDTSGPTQRWSGLKNLSYDQRELFFAGLPELKSHVEAQIGELVAKRATMDANNTSTEVWDFAMQEMERARTTLLSTSADMSKADRDVWEQQKDKVGLAWVWTQDAFAKVKASTTN